MTRIARDVLAEHVPLAGRTILDIGSGAGELVRWLRSEGANVVGAECGTVMRQRALDADPDHPDAYVDAGGEDLPFDDGSFDAVLFMKSLHHVPGALRAVALREADRVLRAEGHLFVVEPVPEGPGHEVFSLVDDETVVLAEAQDELRQVPELGFKLVDTDVFDTQWVYDDFEAMEHDVVGIDPTRATAMTAHREVVRSRFAAHATPEPGGYGLTQPLRFHHFRKLALSETG